MDKHTTNPSAHPKRKRKRAGSGEEGMAFGSPGRVPAKSPRPENVGTGRNSGDGDSSAHPPVATPLSTEKNDNTPLNTPVRPQDSTPTPATVQQTTTGQPSQATSEPTSTQGMDPEGMRQSLEAQLGRAS